MRKGEKILITGTNWIGDSVMSLAALRELRRLFPHHHLTLLVRPWVAGVFEGQGVVDEIRLSEKISPPWHNLPQRLAQFRGFDTAILLPNAFRAALTVRLAGIPHRVGYSTDGRAFLLTRRARPRIRQLGRHQIYYYLDLLYQTGLSRQNYLNHHDFTPDIHLRATPRGQERAEQLLFKAGVKKGRPLVLLNPGGHYGSAKRWLTERYAQLADRLIENSGVEVAIIGSPNERILAQEIQSYMKHSPKILSGETDIACLLGLLSRCALLLTNDSGPMHLGAALEIPLVALFGSTDEEATGPFSPFARVIHKHVECSPCLLRECPIDLRCFWKIEVDEVYEAARALL